MLREYWKRERPPVWLFSGQGKCGHVSPHTVRQVFRRAREPVGQAVPDTIREATDGPLDGGKPED